MNYIKRRRPRRSIIPNQGKWSVTAWIIAINVVIYLILTIYLIANISSIEDPSSLTLFNYFALKPTSILQGEFLSSIVLHMFTHTFFFHLLINMFVLFSLGMFCERIIGRKRFLWFYITAGLFAGILSVLLSGFFGATVWGARIFGSPNIPSVGASGAIFGLAALLMMLIPRLKFTIIFLPFFSLSAYIIIPAALFIMWGLTILFGWPIGNVAHFGGFLVGLIYGLYLRSKYKRKIERLQRMFR